MGRRHLAGLLVLGAALVACGQPRPFSCALDEECVADGMQGRCEPSQFCSFPDPACAGNRYEPNAGDGLGGNCVHSSCGGLGQPCCDGEPPCETNGYCNAGTCTACLQDVRYGRRFGCALAHDGTVWCIGSNHRGQVGLDPGGEYTTWVPIRDGVTGEPITNATAIGAGADHACAIRGDTSLWCWGANPDGQLGNNSTTDASVAVQVTMLSNGLPLLGVVTVAAGYSHTCAITGNSGVWCWGRNNAGQLGDGSTTTPRLQAVPVLAAGGGVFGGASAITIGRYHTCVNTVNHQVACWGLNTKGQLADGSMDNRTMAVPIGTWISVAAGHPQHTCMVDPTGHAWCAGWSFRMRLGTGAHSHEDDIPESYPTPQAVLVEHGGAQLDGVAQVAASSASCALMIDGSVRCWGANNHGQLGTGIGTPHPLPVVNEDGSPLTDVVELTTGWAHTCARTSSGNLVCWGRGVSGELADGSLTEHYYPTAIAAPSCP
ncbi:MAG: RCC1 domain-containing protein [Kofleriaceae bacterium]